MNKKSSTVKITPSVNNLIFLFLLAFSIFIIYRYVKSLEKELSLLKNELTAIKATPKNTNDCEGDVCVLPESSPEIKHLYQDEETEEDIDSVTSKDILKIVDQINNEDTIEDVISNVSEPICESTEVEGVVVVDESTEVVDDSGDLVNGEYVSDDVANEDIVLKKNSNSYEDELYKMTNDNLKKILKNNGKNTKGAKAELIKRILENP